MNLLTQFSFLNAGRTGSTAAGGGGLLGPILGFFALFFLQSHYNAFILTIESVTGWDPFDPTMPLTLMAMSAVMFWWPILAFIHTDGEKIVRGFFVTIIRSLVGFAMMAASVPLFVFALLHWAFATT